MVTDPLVQLNVTGLPLGPFGFRHLLPQISNTLLPTLKQSFGRFGNKFLGTVAMEICHLYIVKYELNKDVYHPPHRDDSHVTVNLCLGDNFQGGNLYFYDDQYQSVGSIKQVPGTAILHPGSMIHGAEEITSGNR
jgi:hypothetical protein